jgi:replicative DNA helicase
MTDNLKSDQFTPYSIDAEDAVLGAVLVNPEAIYDIPYIKQDDFFITRNAWVWETMLSLSERREPIDILTVSTDLEQRNKLQEVGGLPRLLDLVNRTPSALNIDGYARIVERMGVRRRLLNAAQTIARAAHSEDTDIQNILTLSQDAVSGVSERHVSTVSRSRDISEVAASVQLEAIQRRDNPSETRGLATGLYPFDMATGGLEGSLLYEIAARPRMGKSALLADIIRRIAEQGVGVVVFSLEMSDGSMARRMGIQKAGISATDLKKGRLTKDDFDKFIKAMDDIGKMRNLVIEPKAGLSIADMKAKVSVCNRAYPVGLVVVDTMNRVSGDGKDAYHKVTNVSHAAADWAHDADFPILMAVQFKRVLYPSLEALRDSGAIEEDADWIGGLHREYANAVTAEEKRKVEEEGKKNLAELVVLKNRDGDGDSEVGAEMFWDSKTLTFRRIDKQIIDLDSVPYGASHASYSSKE